MKLKTEMNTNDTTTTTNFVETTIALTNAVSRGEEIDQLIELVNGFFRTEFGLELVSIVDLSLDVRTKKYVSYGGGDQKKSIQLIMQYVAGDTRYSDKIIELNTVDNFPSYMVLSESVQDQPSKDIITALGDIIAMSISNKALQQQTVEQFRISEELRMAHQVQETLMTQIFPHPEELDVDTLYIPFREVSGDYYDYMQIDENRVLICIADVSGKGVPAALMMASFQATLRRLVINYTDLHMLVRKMNSAIFNNTKGERFISAFFMEYDLRKNILKYINAGHNYPRLMQGDIVWELRSGTSLLGLNEDLAFLEQETIQIVKETLLFLYTDGLGEIPMQDGSIFESEELNKFLYKNQNQSAEVLNSEIKTYISNYKDLIKDDITIFTCKIHPFGIN